MRPAKKVCTEEHIHPIIRGGKQANGQATGMMPRTGHAQEPQPSRKVLSPVSRFGSSASNPRGNGDPRGDFGTFQDSASSFQSPQTIRGDQPCSDENEFVANQENVDGRLPTESRHELTYYEACPRLKVLPPRKPENDPFQAIRPMLRLLCPPRLAQIQ